MYAHLKMARHGYGTQTTVKRGYVCCEHSPSASCDVGCCCVQRELEGHLTDVETCRFFPSGVVVLSGGSDMMLKIWSAQDGSCPRTLIGHTGGQGAYYLEGG